MIVAICSFLNCGIIHIYIVAFLDVCDICLAILTKRIFMILYFCHFLLILQVKKKKEIQNEELVASFLSVYSTEEYYGFNINMKKKT